MKAEKNQNDTVTDNIIKVGVKGQIYITNLLTNRDVSSYLRVTVESGGCSGFVYKFFVEDDDVIMESDTIVWKDPKIVVDALSILYITGSTLNLQEDVSGNRLVLDNPQAVQGCGCGISFTLKKIY